MVESIKIKIGHQFCFYIINRFGHPFQKFIKIFFVQKNFMTVITIFIKPFPAFCNR